MRTRETYLHRLRNVKLKGGVIECIGRSGEILVHISLDSEQNRERLAGEACSSGV